MHFDNYVHISDTSGNIRFHPNDVEEPTVEACISRYYSRCKTIDDVRRHLESVNGYGYIDVDGTMVLWVA